MKATTFFSILFILFTTSAFAQDAVEASLVKVLREQTAAVINKDFSKWESKWVHDDNVSYTNIGSSSQFKVVGWEKLKTIVENSIKEGTKPRSFDIVMDSITTRTDKNLAWIDYDQTLTFTDSTEHKNFMHQSCVLVKQNDEWKVVSMMVVRPNSFDSFDPSDIENTLNTTGYNLINGSRLDQAIEVFKLNVKLHPKAWNTYDSLGEAYALAGDKKLAIENYQLSMKLNPKNDNGKKALEKLMK